MSGSPPTKFSATTTSSQPPEMSAASKAMLAKVKKLVPPMLEKFHKGQCGRVAVIGGSADYTGAPFFSAIASARLGCDLSYVFCEPSASATIKSYSPNLMVSPILRSAASLKHEKGLDWHGEDKDSAHEQSEEELASSIVAMLPRLHVLVIGPGLGRDSITQKQVRGVIKEAKKHDPPIPLVLDADALWLVQQDPELVQGYKECILTPNVVEFGRMAKALRVDVGDGKLEEQCTALSKHLGGVCIIQKGKYDYISNGETTAVADFQGGLKRSGGQGDTLTGSVGTFLGWRQIYHEGLWDTKGDKMSRAESLLCCAFGGAAITRECSRRAFEKRGRSLQASDLTEEVHGSFLELIGEPEGDWEEISGGAAGKEMGDEGVKSNL